MTGTREQPAAKIAILEGLAEAWNRRGIRYAVCHGLEGYPRSVGRDLDVMVRGRELSRAARIAAGYLRTRGFDVLTPPKPWGGRWLFALRDGLHLEIDLIPFLFRGPVLLAGSPQHARRVGPFPVDPWASFAKRILMPLLGGEPPRPPLLTRGEGEAVRPACERLFGRKLARELLSCLQEADALRLRKLGAGLRKASVRRALLGRPLRSLWLSAAWVRKSFLPYFSKCAPIIALAGPDGVGKSATLQAMRGSVGEPFCGVVGRHWRPGVLPPPGSLLGRPGPEPDPDGLLPPRRRPGRLHWLRLAYYFIDFTLGHFLKDRPASSRLQVVVYDRLALDMAVDPSRYGLSSPRGTRLFWRLIPRPDLVVLLYDQPGRVRGRKPELEAAEIQRQLKEWLRLVAEGEVGAVIRMDGGPLRAARDLGELITEAFRELNRGPRSRKANDNGWLAAALGALPIAAHRVLEPRGGRQYLIPPSPRQAALAALRLYRPQKPGPRLALGLLAAAVRWGPGARLLPKADAPAAREAGLLDYLQKALAHGPLSLGLSTGTAGPSRKPVLLLMNREGRPLGYAKIGWNVQTSELVGNERKTLEYFAGRSLEHGRLPGVLHFGTWNGRSVLVTEPLELPRRGQRELTDLHVQFLLEVARAEPRREKFAESAFFSGLQAGIRDVGEGAPSYQRRVLQEAADLLGSKLGSRELPFVWRMGDFAPWNLGVDGRAGKILAVDLEYAAPRDIPGWDLFHFLSGSLTRQPLAGRAWKYFQALEVDPELVPWLRAAYLAGLCLRWIRLWCAPGILKTAEALRALRAKSNQLFLLLETLKGKGAAAQ
jgi:hypothetical protein